MTSFRSFLNEGKVSPNSFAAGMVLDCVRSGQYAKTLSVDGESTFGGEVKVLGLGIVHFNKEPTKKDIIGDSLKDIKSKYKEQWKEIGPKYHASKQAMMKSLLLKILEDTSKIKDGHLAWILEVIDGVNKGKIVYIYHNMDGWNAPYLNKSTAITFTK